MRYKKNSKFIYRCANIFSGLQSSNSTSHYNSEIKSKISLLQYTSLQYYRVLLKLCNFHLKWQSEPPLARLCWLHGSFINEMVEMNPKKRLRYAIKQFVYCFWFPRDSYGSMLKFLLRFLLTLVIILIPLVHFFPHTRNALLS